MINVANAMNFAPLLSALSKSGSPEVDHAATIAVNMAFPKMAEPAMLSDLASRAKQFPCALMDLFPNFAKCKTNSATQVPGLSQGSFEFRSSCRCSEVVVEYYLNTILYYRLSTIAFGSLTFFTRRIT